MMKLNVLTWMAVSILAVVSCGQTTPAIALYLGYNIYSIDAGDFNSDGLPDAFHVAGPSTANDLHIELNQGVGILPLGLTYPGTGGYEVRAFDIDQDGDLDFVFSNSAPVLGNASATLKVVTNTLGTLSVSLIQVRGSALPDLVDLDGDGLLDLLSNGAWNRALSPGVFAYSSTPIVGQFPGLPLLEVSINRQREYEPGDFDGDGDVDLLRYRRASNFHAFADLYKNDGSGNFVHSFSEPVAFPSIQVPSTKLHVADLNGDGIDDFIAEQLGAGTLLIHYGDPTGLFLGGTFAIAGTGYFQDTADLDGDGDRDIIVRRPVVTAPLPPVGPPQAPSLNVIENLGAGVFVEPTASTLSFYSDRLSVTDLDGDSKDDFLYAGPYNFLGFGVAYGNMTSSGPTTTRRQILGVSGYGQVVPTNQPVPAPLVVQVLNELNQPAVGEVLSISSDAGLSLPATVMTNASGMATIPLGTATLTGLKRITVSCGAAVSTRFSVHVTPTQKLTVLSGANQGANPLTYFPQPLRLRLTDLAGTPLPGVAVDLYGGNPVTGAAPIIGSPFITDAFGEIAASILSDQGGSPGSAGNIGTKNIVARTAASDDLPVQFFTRRLVPLNFYDATGTYKGVRYHHENLWVPLILMADVPQPAPVPTIFGDVYTSWLSPGPKLFYLDGLGLTGPPASGLLTVPKAGQPGFVYELTFPATLLPYFTQVVFQVLTYDNAYAFPEKVGLSEPVLIIF